MSLGGTKIGRRAFLVAAAAAGVSACSGSGGDNTSTTGSTKGATPVGTTSTSAPTPAPTATQATLPGGGRTILPGRRLVGYCGMPGAPALGELGVGNDLQAKIDKMLKVVKDYDDGSAKPLPVMELIATVVHPYPGKDGMYRERMPAAVLDEWTKAAKDNGSILLLDIQPGRASFLDEAKAFEKWLLEPHVGLALDPEWAILAGQTPGKHFGTTTGAAVDEVAKYLSDLVTEHDLPQKALVVHVLRRSIFTAEDGLKDHPGVAVIKSVDGIGVPQDKVKAYEVVMKDTPPHIRAGFKIFYSEDTAGGGPLMQPAEVLALTPKPDYVMYE
ncbi:hypothetical protein [Calidifontibacter indicus]|uniref:hypothetical protein n=1 Tax=Calidifontibacter indicus TaxID=419650 RepID=UPI003D722BF0